MRVAAITTVYNESYFLPIWLRYYSSQLGSENLFVIDHGSDDGSTEGIMANRIRIPRSELDDDIRVSLVSKLHRALLECFDIVLYVDVDEFILARPSKHDSLFSYCQSGWSGVRRCVGVDVFQHDPAMDELDPTANILKQRPYGRFNYWVSKPLLSSVPVEWTVGFHECNVASEVDLDVFLFHLKLADQVHFMERLAVTRALRWSKKTLEKGHSEHQRVSDKEMLERISEVQANRLDQPLNLLDARRMLDCKIQSKELRRIPEEFLKML